jgi:Spy/CpxP family protein refolding chaperone
MYAQNRPMPNMKEWMKELRQYKHDMFAKRLNLSREQQEKFFPLYDEMDNSVMELNRNTRMLEDKIVRSKDKVSDLEYEKSAEAIYEMTKKQGEIEMEYFAKFKTILTPQQLFRLKQAERDFSRELMRQHSRARANKN